MKKDNGKKELKIPTGIAMTPTLKQRIEKKAREQGRSFSQQVCFVLEKHA